MIRFFVVLTTCFVILILTACAENRQSESTADSETAAVAENPIDFDGLEQTLKSTPVVLRMPRGVCETNLWDMGMRIDPNGNRYYDPILLDGFCTGICRDSAIPPIDASVQYNGGEVPFAYTDGSDGSTVRADNMANLLKGLSYTSDAYSIALPAEDLPPSVTTDDLSGERQLIASYSTSFSRSPLNNKNRVFNITKAATMIDGVEVLPGESFSMNRTIGDRNKKNGWKTATAISGGKYTKEYGGGVCQVSSTLFNAVLMANLEITERYHHSWPMTYVPIGRDATISTGSKDFIFRNDTDSPVTVSAQVNEKRKTVTVSLYGTPPSDYAYIEIVSERTGSVSSKGEKQILDESLPNNTRVVERKARTGRKSATYRCFYDIDGNLLKRETAYEDTYPSIQGIVYLSPDLYY